MAQQKGDVSTNLSELSRRASTPLHIGSNLKHKDLSLRRHNSTPKLSSWGNKVNKGFRLTRTQSSLINKEDGIFLQISNGTCVTKPTSSSQSSGYTQLKTPGTSNARSGINSMLPTACIASPVSGFVSTSKSGVVHSKYDAPFSTILANSLNPSTPSNACFTHLTQNSHSTPKANKAEAATPDSGFCTPSFDIVTERTVAQSLFSSPVSPIVSDDVPTSKSYAKDDQSVGAMGSLANLKPLPVIMAPTVPRLSFLGSGSCLGDSAFMNTLMQDAASTRKVLEELQPNTLVSGQAEEDERPKHSFMDLIKMALGASPDGQMTLKEIISWIENRFPYFRKVAKDSWKNSIRHNLSLHGDFTRAEGKKNGGKWKLAPEAKKFVHRILKPPAPPVKPPPPPLLTKKRRSGPQLILPKTMPYALVPIALGPGTPYALNQPQQPLSFQQQQIMLQTHQQQQQQQQLDISQLSQQQQEQLLTLLQQQQKPMPVNQQPNQNHAQQSGCEPPSVVLSQTDQPKEVQVHIKLTREQQEMFRREQTTASTTSADSETCFVDNERVTKPKACLPRLIPKPGLFSSQPNLRATKENIKSADNRPRLGPPLLRHNSCAGTSRYQPDHVVDGKIEQDRMKRRNIYKILDRMRKSKSFETSRTRDLEATSKSGVQRRRKLAPVSNLTSIMKEDEEATKEIQRILQEGDSRRLREDIVGAETRSIPLSLSNLEGNHQGERQPALNQYDHLISPDVWEQDTESAPVQQGCGVSPVWEREESCGSSCGFVMDEATVSSVLSDDVSCQENICVGGAFRNITEQRTVSASVKDGPAHDAHTFVKDGPAHDAHTFPSLAQERTCEAVREEINTHGWNNFVEGSAADLNHFDFSKSSLFNSLEKRHSPDRAIDVSDSQDIDSDSIWYASVDGEHSLSMSTSNITSCDISLTSGKLSTSSQFSSCMSTAKPRLYRTRSRRKQIHVPLKLTPDKDHRREVDGFQGNGTHRPAPDKDHRLEVDGFQGNVTHRPASHKDHRLEVDGFQGNGTHRPASYKDHRLEVEGHGPASVPTFKPTELFASDISVGNNDCPVAQENNVHAYSVGGNNNLAHGQTRDFSDNVKMYDESVSNEPFECTEISRMRESSLCVSPKTSRAFDKLFSANNSSWTNTVNKFEPTRTISRRRKQTLAPKHISPVSKPILKSPQALQAESMYEKNCNLQRLTEESETTNSKSFGRIGPLVEAIDDTNTTHLSLMTPEYTAVPLPTFHDIPSSPPNKRDIGSSNFSSNPVLDAEKDGSQELNLDEANYDAIFHERNNMNPVFYRHNRISSPLNSEHICQLNENFLQLSPVSETFHTPLHVPPKLNSSQTQSPGTAHVDGVRDEDRNTLAHLLALTQTPPSGSSHRFNSSQDIHGGREKSQNNVSPKSDRVIHTYRYGLTEDVNNCDKTQEVEIQNQIDSDQGVHFTESGICESPKTSISMYTRTVNNYPILFTSIQSNCSQSNDDPYHLPRKDAHTVSAGTHPDNSIRSNEHNEPRFRKNETDLSGCVNVDDEDDISMYFNGTNRGIGTAESNEVDHAGSTNNAAENNDSSYLNCSIFDNIESLMHTSLTEPNPSP